MKSIAIITAMDSEYNAIYSLYNFKGDNSRSYTQVYDKDIYLIKSGIGKVNATIATLSAIENGVDVVITTGLAGGIDASLSQGDIVLADKIAYHDVYCGEPNEKGQVQDLPLYYELSSDILKSNIKEINNGYFKLGLALTGDQFITDETQLLQIKSDFPQGLAVDMESAAIAQVCHIFQKDCISLRIISDVVGKENQKEQYRTFWDNIPTKSAEMIDVILRNI